MAKKKPTPPPSRQSSDANSDGDQYTVDSDTTGVHEIPTISTLLNRKKLEISKIYKGSLHEVPESPKDSRKESKSDDSKTPKKTPSPPPPPAQLKPPPPVAPPVAPMEPLEIPDETSRLMELESFPARDLSAQKLKVQPAKRRSISQTTPKIVLWTREQLQGTSDPLGGGVTSLLGLNAKETLYLAVSFPKKDSPVPCFIASAALATRAFQKLWMGLIWDPKIAPNLWNTFVRSGFIELPPPGIQTEITSDRNVVRTAFGVSGQNYLTILRVGPSQKCRGILAVVSQSSLTTSTTFPSILEEIQTDPKPSSKKQTQSAA